MSDKRETSLPTEEPPSSDSNQHDCSTLDQTVSLVNLLSAMQQSMVDNNRLLQKLTIQTCFDLPSTFPSAHEVNTPGSEEADPPASEEANTPASEEANEPASDETFTISKRESATPKPSNRTGEELPWVPEPQKLKLKTQLSLFFNFNFCGSGTQGSEE